MECLRLRYAGREMARACDDARPHSLSVPVAEGDRQDPS